MPKPTLLQSILGRPSQTYYHPADHDFHSTRDELFRIAHAAKFIPGQFDDSGFDSSTPGNSDTDTHHTPTSRTTPSQRSRRTSEARSSTSDAVAANGVGAGPEHVAEVSSRPQRPTSSVSVRSAL